MSKMLSRGAISLVCLLQFINPVTALPAEQQQQPLQSRPSKNVQAVREELKKAEIIPTVIDDFLPSLTLSIAWPSHHDANLGNTIKPKHLQDQPSITLLDSTSVSGLGAKDMQYTITLTDPDAPSRENPKWSEMCHWIATNVSISESTLSILSLPEHGLTDLFNDHGESSDDVIEYKPPGPPPKTGKHRYVFLVFAPKNGTTERLDLSKPKERQHWGTGKKKGGVRDWARENGLVAVAANFLYAENKKQ